MRVFFYGLIVINIALALKLNNFVTPECLYRGSSRHGLADKTTRE
jgi:hypothetical protein